MERINELRRRIPVWAKLALSLALLGAVGLCFFTALGRPSLTPEGAVARGEGTMLLEGGQTLLQGDYRPRIAEPLLRSAQDTTWPGQWTLRRYGDRYLLWELERVGPLWRVQRALTYTPTPEQPAWDWSWRVGYSTESVRAKEMVFLVIWPDKAVARVEGIAGWIPHTPGTGRRTEAELDAALAEMGTAFSLTQTAPGSGIWTARVLIPDAVLPTGGSAGFHTAYTAYDAQGRVVGEIGP